jgi:hypothetical protein
MHFDKLLEYDFNSKFRLDDDLKLNKASMMGIINKNFGDMSSSGNTVQISGSRTSPHIFDINTRLEMFSNTNSSTQP